LVDFGRSDSRRWLRGPTRVPRRATGRPPDPHGAWLRTAPSRGIMPERPFDRSIETLDEDFGRTERGDQGDARQPSYDRRPSGLPTASILRPVYPEGAHRRGDAFLECRRGQTIRPLCVSDSCAASYRLASCCPVPATDALPDLVLARRADPGAYDFAVGDAEPHRCFAGDLTRPLTR
jgi:hypothetical protein